MLTGIEMNILDRIKTGYIKYVTCEHINVEYIPREDDVNVQENYICLDCGASLPIPEQDDNM
jgi:hypothetical protein